jgi:hypothetical protein
MEKAKKLAKWRAQFRARYHGSAQVREDVAERVRKARAKYPERYKAYHRRHNATYRAKFPGRIKARYALQYAVKTGRIVRKPCEVCGETEQIQAHHSDYRRPLRVRWFCREHHKALHCSGKRRGATPNPKGKPATKDQLALPF